jgi:hypothetical protein
MTDEGHELRHNTAKASAALIDALDDDALDLYDPACLAIYNLTVYLQAKGISRAHAIGLCIGIVLDTCIED